MFIKNTVLSGFAWSLSLALSQQGERRRQGVPPLCLFSIGTRLQHLDVSAQPGDVRLVAPEALWLALTGSQDPWGLGAGVQSTQMEEEGITEGKSIALFSC